MFQRLLFCSLLLQLIFSTSLSAQWMVDAGFGTSREDNFFSQISIRKNFSERLRIGLTYQYGLPNIRYVGAKPFTDDGYATTVSIPVSLLLAQEEKINLFGFLKAGFRVQGIFDPDENDQRDSVFRSTALISEIGVLTQLHLSEDFQLQAGLTFPVSFELDPTTLFENLTTNLHLGSSLRVGQNVLFVKGTMGPSFGGGGDTHKFMWGAQAGMRFRLGAKDDIPHFDFVESTF